MKELLLCFYLPSQARKLGSYRLLFPCIRLITRFCSFTVFLASSYFSDPTSIQALHVVHCSSLLVHLLVLKFLSFPNQSMRVWSLTYQCQFGIIGAILEGWQGAHRMGGRADQSSSRKIRKQG